MSDWQLNFISLEGNHTSWCEMIESINSSSHPASEIVAYHKVKRKFLSLKDMEQEDPDQLQICEFSGQDFELVAD